MKRFARALTLLATLLVLFLAAMLFLFLAPREEAQRAPATAANPTTAEVIAAACCAALDSPAPDRHEAAPAKDTLNKFVAEPQRHVPEAAQSPSPTPTIADILEASGDLSDPDARAEAVRAVRELETTRREAARARAEDLDLPLRIELPDGTVKEIYDFEEEFPVYRVTHNLNAAISVAADLLQNDPVFPLRGDGVTIGMWDGGAARATHQEFGTRVTLMNTSSAITHATHVGGTLIGAGIDARALGMAPAGRVDSYDWNNDKSEMIERGAASPGEPGKLYISNHSYGFVAGWLRTGQSSPRFEWHGRSSTVETLFGAYHPQARDSDAIAHSAPYFLMFRSAGNDRNENPLNGDSVALSPGGSVVTYDSSSHPPGDGIYRGGYDTISFDSVAKNVMTVGGVNDAVNNGVRDLSRAGMSTFSSWGPTDDGRIKPDIVANGVSVLSASAGSNTTYSTMSGTSMAAPNAAGAAALLVELYDSLFPGGAMRASTLKGLLIHTADDLGTPGPDYRFGWGLLNTKAAADLIREHAVSPEAQRMTEATITAADSVHTYTFVWDGESPIQATLSWTDPAGTATTNHDLRSPRLRNNLHLHVDGPNGNVNLPYVMPFVGTWTQASMSEQATTGINNTDNVNQVYIAEPPASGVYTVVVSFSGTLADNRQTYSLLLSGSSAEKPPLPPLDIVSISPVSGLSGESVSITINGTGFDERTSVRLTRPGHADIEGTAFEVLGNGARAVFDLTEAAGGAYDLTSTRPDSEPAILESAFSVIDAVWSETFDGAVSGWDTSAEIGSNQWSLTTARSHTPERSYHAPGVSQRSLTNLTSPEVQIPAESANLQLRFWQRRAFPTNRHAGKLEYSINGGSWIDIAAENSGAAFLSNGYNGTVFSGGPPNGRNPFAGETAWVGSTTVFAETIINLVDSDRFAGNRVRFRWRFGTNSGNTSEGWWIDTISLLGDGLGTGTPPVIISGPDATFSFLDNSFPVIETISTDLSVEAESSDGGSLIYSWSVDGSTTGTVSFSENDSSSAGLTTATFPGAGHYAFSVTVQNPDGLTTTGSVDVEVRQVATELSVSPAATTVPVHETQTFTATVLDQFAVALATQPTGYAWAVSGGGTIDNGGVFTATTAGDFFTVRADSGELSGMGTLTVSPLPATVTLSGLNQVFDGTPKPVTVTTEPPGLATHVTYNGSENAPIDAGSYAVWAQVVETNYRGDAEAFLVIEVDPESDGDAALRDLIAEYFPDADFDTFDLAADHNGNGMATLVDLAFGNNPAAINDPTFALTFESTASGVVITHPLDRVVAGVLAVSVERSLDLAYWSPLVDGEDGVTRQVQDELYRAAASGTEDTSAVDQVQFTVPPDQPLLFIRVRVTPEK